MGDRLGTLGAVDFPFVRVPKPLMVQRELSTLGIFLQVRQAKGGPGQAPVPIPPLKQTNKLDCEVKYSYTNVP